MTSTESPARRSIADSLAVYLQRRVLIVLLLGFSSGLPLVLTGATLQAWLKVSGIDVKTIGLVTAVAVPYNFKFLWAPLVDALDVPVLGKLLGRRRGWLLLAQIWLMAAILFLGSCDPTVSVLTVVVGAVIVATASATQDIVVDAFRVESLPEDEQAAGMASYVAAYRVGASGVRRRRAIPGDGLPVDTRPTRRLDGLLRRHGGADPCWRHGDPAGDRAGRLRRRRQPTMRFQSTAMRWRAHSGRRSTASAIFCPASSHSSCWGSWCCSSSPMRSLSRC